MSSLIVLPLLFSPATATAEAHTVPARIELNAEAGYAELMQEHERAHAAWKKQYSEEEDKKKKRELRKQKPAVDYYPKFKALADGGEGRALLWMAANARDAGFKKKEADTIKVEAASRLVREFVAEEWFADAVKMIVKERRSLGMDVVEQHVMTIVARSPHEVTQALAMADLAMLFERSKDEAENKKGRDLYARLEKDFSDDVLGQALSGPRFKAMFLKKGKVAPDFTTEDVDGATFKLSDYRGQVVLIDFWGFW